MSTAFLPKLTARLGLPLLEKELVEQAARKRTYIIRVVYAIVFSMAALMMFYEFLAIGWTSPFAVLGRGRELFEFLMGLQFAGVYLFAPAMTCGVIAQEKERSSLMLLFLTRLGPWSILFEKLLGRLIPLGGYLLISLPLLAYAYSLGGISSVAIWCGAGMLFVTMLQVTTLALACSAWFRTTVSAFVATYLIGLVALFLPGLLIQIGSALFFGERTFNRSSAFWAQLENAGWVHEPESLLFPLFIPMQFFDRPVLDWSDAFKLAVRSIPALLGSGFCVVLARAFLVKRAAASPRNVLLAMFKWADRLFSRWNNNRLTRGIEILPDRTTFPDFHPVAWRETAKRSLGQARYLFRIFIAIEGPLGVCVLILAMVSVAGEMEAGSVLVLLLWTLAGLIVSVQSASLIAGERSQQTLDVLCTTPLSGRDVLLQKFRGVRRVTLVLLIPFLTMFLFIAYWRSSLAGGTNYNQFHRYSTPQYLVCSLLSVAIYLPLVAWISFFVGLKVRTQSRAIIGALAAVVGWCILPIVFIVVPIAILTNGMGGAESVLPFVTLLSPATIIHFNEFGQLYKFAGAPWLAIFLNFFGYGLILYVVRSFCLAHADRFLGRVDAEVER